MSARKTLRRLRAAGVAAMVVAVLAVAARTARATPDGDPVLTITWHTVDAGGAIGAVGGALTLHGSVGQPDTGALTGGYTLNAGFWGGFAWGQTFVADTRRARLAGW